MPLTTEVVLAPIDELLAWERNPRRITPDRLEALKRSISEDPEMLTARPLIALRGVDYAPDGTVIAGNQRLTAAAALGIESVPVVYVTIEEQRAISWALRDNVGYGEWEDEALTTMLRELDAQEFDLSLTGFPKDDIDALFAEYGGDQPDPIQDRGVDLQLTDVSIGDPKHQCVKGEVWNVGPHIMVVAEVYDGWSAWVKYLDQEDVLLVPYPTPTLTLTVRADVHRLVLVQPDPWLAGHVLDKYAAVRGEETVSRVDG